MTYMSKVTYKLSVSKKKNLLKEKRKVLKISNDDESNESYIRI